MANNTAKTTQWKEFFRTLTMHRPGYSARFTEKATTKASDTITNALAKILFMLPMPEGHHMEPSVLAKAWIKENAT